MASDYDNSQGAAAVYAESMLQLAEERNIADDIGAELADIAQLWKDSPEFAGMMRSAAIDDDARRESIKKIFTGKVNELVLNLMLVLNDKHRAASLPYVCDAYRKKLDEKHGREDVFVTSAVELNDAQRDKIRAEVKRITGFEASLRESIDASLIGGMRILIRDRLMDFTVKRRLGRMKNELLRSGDSNLRNQSARFVTEG